MKLAATICLLWFIADGLLLAWIYYVNKHRQ